MSTSLQMPAQDPTSTGFGPSSISVEPHHLSITSTWDSGSSSTIHLLENGDLGVILARGQDGRAMANPVPHDSEDSTGLVVISLGVDQDHDEVHFTHAAAIDLDELLGQAIETLVTCRHAVKRSR